MYKLYPWHYENFVNDCFEQWLVKETDWAIFLFDYWSPSLLCSFWWLFTQDTSIFTFTAHFQNVLLTNFQIVPFQVYDHPDKSWARVHESHICPFFLVRKMLDNMCCLRLLFQVLSTLKISHYHCPPELPQKGAAICQLSILGWHQHYMQHCL